MKYNNIMTQIDKDIIIISDILNEDKTFHKIANKLRLQIDSDDMFFYDIEEYILKNFKRMHNQITYDNDTI